MLVYKCLLTKRLHGKVAVLQQITKKQRNLFVQGNNHTYLEIHTVMKHMQKHLTLFKGI